MTTTTRMLTGGAALAFALTGCAGNGGSETLGAGSPTTTPSASATDAPLSRALAIYWVGESRASFALYREFRDAPDVGGTVASAVAAMTRLTPLDPDYVNPWRPATRVTVSQTGDALTVDLSADALSNTQVGSELADRAVQQLVYTATAAAQQAGTPASTVRVLVDGAAADAWGAVQLGQPMRRAALASVQAHSWITSPQEGASLPAGQVTFKGFGTSFEANFTWKVRSATGAVVKDGFTMGGTGDGGFGEFTFTAQLTPGSYVVEVSTGDPSGGAEGPGPAIDTKAFTVR